MDWEKCELESVINWYELTNDFKKLLLKHCDKIDQDQLRKIFFKHGLELLKNEKEYKDEEKKTELVIKKYISESRKINDEREADNFLEKQLKNE